MTNKLHSVEADFCDMAFWAVANFDIGDQSYEKIITFNDNPVGEDNTVFWQDSKDLPVFEEHAEDFLDSVLDEALDKMNALYDRKVSEARAEVIESKDAYDNLDFVERYGKPELHRQAVIDSGDMACNLEFIEKYGDHELHRKAIMESGNEYYIELFIKKYGS